MPIPKAIIFDIGNVLLKFDYGLAVGRLRGDCSLSEEGLHRLINQSELLHRYETGLITSDEFFAEIKSSSGYRGEMADFRPHFSDIFTPIPEIIQLQGQLRARGFPTYIFSNTNELAVAHIRERYPFFKDFDGYFLSFEHRSMKPHPVIYDAVERGTGLSGGDLLYLDDRFENVEAGAARGWRVIHHAEPEATLAEIRRAGISI